MANTWPSCTQQGMYSEVIEGERKPLVRHLPGRMTWQRSPAPWPPVSLAAQLSCKLGFRPQAVTQQNSRTPQSCGEKRSFRHPPHAFAKALTRQAAASSPNHPHGLPPGPHFGSRQVPMSQDLSVHRAAWLSALQQHSPSPAAPALGGVPTTPCTTQQPLRMNEGASPPLDFAVLVARTQTVCWEVPETEPGPQSTLTKDPSPCP